jgi:hypothetical protein
MPMARFEQRRPQPAYVSTGHGCLSSEARAGWWCVPLMPPSHAASIFPAMVHVGSTHTMGRSASTMNQAMHQPADTPAVHSGQ